MSFLIDLILCSKNFRNLLLLRSCFCVSSFTVSKRNFGLLDCEKQAFLELDNAVL